MHVLPLPFGLALALPPLPRHEARVVRNDRRPIRVERGPIHRERVLGDVYAATCRRPIA
jgi:hypothetical protein